MKKTKPQQNEKSPRQFEELFGFLAEAAPFGISIVDKKEQFEYVNPAFTDLFGYSLQDIPTNEDWFHAAYPDPALRQKLLGIYNQDFSKRIGIGNKRSRTYKVRCKNGRKKVIQFRGIPLRNGKKLVTYEDITARYRAEKSVKESELKYRTLFESTPDAIMMLNKKGFFDCNDATLKMFDCSAKKVFSVTHPGSLSPQIQPDGSDSMEAANNHINTALQTGSCYFEWTHQRMDGTTFPAEVLLSIFQLGRRKVLQALVRDITPRKQAKRKLKKREQELEEKSNNLEEVNTALRVLLKKREEDKARLEEKVLLNMRELASPYLEKLKKTALDARQTSFLEILESNLNDVISPFTHRLASTYLNLTPTEIQVANLIKQGKTSKEIAELWNLSSRTVEFHRDNIRKKLQLKNKKTNLRSYLLSLR